MLNGGMQNATTNNAERRQRVNQTVTVTNPTAKVSENQGTAENKRQNVGKSEQNQNNNGAAMERAVCRKSTRKNAT